MTTFPLASLALPLLLAAGTGETVRVSVSSDGAQANGTCTVPVLAGNGRVAAFVSKATNLAPFDSNAADDVFVRDLATGKTARVSVASSGAQGNGDSDEPALSGNGRLVVFKSSASNLVVGDGNGSKDIFLHDRLSGETTRVSVASDGAEADDDSFAPAITANGRFVAFSSYASNLVPGDTNGEIDVFVRDLKSGETTRVSVGSGGEQADDSSYWASLSANGRFVAFVSEAGNLVPGDSSLHTDVFVHDRKSGETTRVSVDISGGSPNDGSDAPFLSANGRYVAFESSASDLVPGDGNGTKDVFVRDRKTGMTTRVSVDSQGAQAAGHSSHPSLSKNGRLVAFSSGAANLVPGDGNTTEDVFVHDRKSAKTSRVSVDSAGAQGNSGSHAAAISPGGRHVAFRTLSTNLVPGDTNGFADILVHVRKP